jgi:hypothetical protein
VALNTALALGLSLRFSVDDLSFTALDVVGAGVVAVMVALLVVRAVRDLRELAREEPAAPRR